jgi:hypothetical protein
MPHLGGVPARAEPGDLSILSAVTEAGTVVSFIGEAGWGM